VGREGHWKDGFAVGREVVEVGDLGEVAELGAAVFGGLVLLCADIHHIIMLISSPSGNHMVIPFPQRLIIRRQLLIFFL
jgi:hypothetical protein